MTSSSQLFINESQGNYAMDTTWEQIAMGLGKQMASWWFDFSAGYQKNPKSWINSDFISPQIMNKLILFLFLSAHLSREDFPRSGERSWTESKALTSDNHHCWAPIFILFTLSSRKWASLVAQTVKNMPAVGKTWLRSLGCEDPLEEGMATHSSILAWRIPMDKRAWRAIVHRVAKSWTQLSDKTQHSTGSKCLKEQSNFYLESWEPPE